MRARWPVLLASAVSASIPATTLAELADITVTRNGQSASLSEAARRSIVEGMPRLFETCSLNTRDHPAQFRSWDLKTVWGKVKDGDHIYMHLSQVMDLRLPGSRTVRVDELLLGLGEARYPGPELSRHNGAIVAYVKCSGYELIRFVCAPGVKEVVPERYHELCRHVDGRE